MIKIKGLDVSSSIWVFCLWCEVDCSMHSAQWKSYAWDVPRLLYNISILPHNVIWYDCPHNRFYEPHTPVASNWSIFAFTTDKLIVMSACPPVNWVPSGTPIETGSKPDYGRGYYLILCPYIKHKSYPSHWQLLQRVAGIEVGSAVSYDDPQITAIQLWQTQESGTVLLEPYNNIKDYRLEEA